MGTLVQYITEFAPHSFAEYPMTAVDILLLTELLYLKFDYIIPIEATEALSLAKAGELFLENLEHHRENNAFLVTEHRVNTLKASFQSTRYAEIELFHFVNDISIMEEKQFAASTYRINQDTYLIVFRGTDDTLVGWKEDFNLSYSEEIPAQIEAAQYLEDIASKIDGNFYVSGHSKGGNLAIYAATTAHFNNERLLGVYSFDGPGFHPNFLQEKDFIAIADKIHYYIPQEAIVGEILTRNAQPTIIKSKQFGLLQHDPNNWEIDEEGQFVEVEETTALSVLIAETFKRWLNQRNNAELKRFFDTIFELFQQANITSLNDLTDNFWDCIRKLRSAISELNPELRDIIDSDLNALLDIAWNISKEHNVEQYRSWQQAFEEWFNSLKDATIARLFPNKDTITLSPPPRTQPPINPITKEELWKK
ncbi:DUF2974 domain-containing protein [Aerococcaceae bacterium NML210727]|nr:DUF2974 domain-containing protein [Aerococcaceae bacterium NML210727]MCW6654191.1 DUF2974 domain-containing protein [Aerococcaceae bacterium NML201296]